MTRFSASRFANDADYKVVIGKNVTYSDDENNDDNDYTSIT